MGAFNEIQEGFREINEAENRVDLTGDAIENKSSADKIKEDIRFISEKLKSNREQIAKLEEQLKNSNYQSAQLKKAIKNLTAQLEEKQRQIETLQAELASKNIRIAELDEAVEEAVHRALLQRQGLAYLKGLVRAVGAEEFQNVENFL